jgi:magnesium-transporting ATPase (P-type)
MPEMKDEMRRPLLESKKDEVIFIPDEAGEGGPADEDEKPFVYNSKGLSSEEARRLLEIHGLNQLPEKKIPKWKIFVNLLIAPMPLMIFFAAFIEWSIVTTPTWEFCCSLTLPTRPLYSTRPPRPPTLSKP